MRFPPLLALRCKTSHTPSCIWGWVWAGGAEGIGGKVAEVGRAASPGSSPAKLAEVGRPGCFGAASSVWAIRMVGPAGWGIERSTLYEIQPIHVLVSFPEVGAGPQGVKRA